MISVKIYTRRLAYIGVCTYREFVFGACRLTHNLILVLFLREEFFFAKLIVSQLVKEFPRKHVALDDKY